MLFCILQRGPICKMLRLSYMSIEILFEYPEGIEGTREGISDDGIEGAKDEAITSAHTSHSQRILRIDLVRRLRLEPLADVLDINAAVELVEVVEDSLENISRDQEPILGESEFPEAVKALKAVLTRLGIDFTLPYRSYRSYRYYCHGQDLTSVMGRGVDLEQTFAPVKSALERIEDNMLRQPLVSPVFVDDENDKWRKVRREYSELKRAYARAITEEEMRALGTNCIGVLEAVADAVYVPALHDVYKDVTKPPEPDSLSKDRPHKRLQRYLRHELQGSENEDVRKTVGAVIALANRVKHGDFTSAVEAGIATDATLLVAACIKRLANPIVSIEEEESPF